MPSIFKTTLCLFTFTSCALAVPNVTVTPATGGCADFPNYEASTGQAGPWNPVLKNSDNSSIEGFGSEYEIVRYAGDTGVHQGRVTMVYRNDEAKLAFRCTNTAAGPFIEAYAPVGVSGLAWQHINITDIPYDAELGWGWGQYSTPLEFFRHEINGTRQPGLFLGHDGYTTWAVQYQPADQSEGVSYAYWNLRLLGKDSQDPQTGAALSSGEVETFLMVGGSA